MKLRDVIPPHEPRNERLLAGLIKAYQDGESVPAIVVIDWDGSTHDGAPPSALCGSHRLAAMREVFDENSVIDNDPDVEIVSADDLEDELQELADDDDERAEQALEALSMLANGDLAHFQGLIDLLLDLGVLHEPAVILLEEHDDRRDPEDRD